MMLHFSHQSDLEKILSNTTDKTIQLPPTKTPQWGISPSTKKAIMMP